VACSAVCAAYGEAGGSGKIFAAMRPYAVTAADVAVENGDIP
jgi:hypothetical protein